MILTPIDISTRPSGISSLETTTTVTEKEFKNVAAEFGDVMHVLLAQQTGLVAKSSITEDTQDHPTAPEALTEETLANMLNMTQAQATTIDSVVLTAIHLGPHLQVITSQTAAPEGQSLEVFARSQGLDEAALQWLMGKTNEPLTESKAPTNPAALTPTPPVPAQFPAPAPAFAPAPAPAPAFAPAPAQAPVPAQAPAEMTTPARAPATAPGPAPALANLTAPTSKSSKETASLGLTEPTSARTGSYQGESGELPKTSMIPEPSNPKTPRLETTSGTWRNEGLVKVDTPLPQARPLEIFNLKHQTASDPMMGATTAAAQATTASEWLQGNNLAVHLIKPHVNSKLETTPLLLDLSGLLPAEMQGSLESMATDGFASGQDSPSQGQGNFNARADANLLTRTDATSNPVATAAQDSAQRRENISTLAEKMGQAVGERILSELERGQWHLKLSLRPATLGHIEVEMRMRSGEMDAVFTAPQALTRELLNEGMSKLKDTLNQMGMDVASLKVDDGQSRQRGGESTPERQTQLRNNAPTETTDAPVSPTVAATHKMGTDGWDVLV